MIPDRSRGLQAVDGVVDADSQVDFDWARTDTEQVDEGEKRSGRLTRKVVEHFEISI